jgi:hypothetical protein
MLVSRHQGAAPHRAGTAHRSEFALPRAQAPYVALPSPWSAAATATATATTAPAPAVERDRPARAEARAAHGTGAPSLPAPATPFGPPGHGVVGSASGVSGTSATAGVVCALLTGVFLLLTAAPLRRHRMLWLTALPAGFTPLQQRPG